MSKSLGNVIAPRKISETLGAEILRLWVATTDTRETFISDEILKGVVRSYRRIRNTLRFLLANISDFDPKRNAMPAGAGWRSTATPWRWRTSAEKRPRGLR
jgi:isoleucyl-tRNA synthetase